MALSIENKTYAWGNGDNGRLGHGSKRSEAIPKQVLALKDVQPLFIFAGEAHSACISFKHTFFTWGKGSYGRLGHGFTSDVYRPEVVEELINVKIEDAALGAYHTFAISSEKVVYAWGGCNFGKLGLRGKSTGNLILPTPIPTLNNKKVMEVVAGPYHTLAVNSKGNLYAWGNGIQGQLGIKDLNSIDIPTKIPLEVKFGNVVSD